ncbi:hypothetical protein NQ176_g6837 [Zarea fungicola]|uniref:Uncharacterized protein n=1 Tax=Zarea fungicola TaxID=93591 RepID=A0ACC1N3J6_9HYPO|nr:hypothetical protein NQ176_g6837 [Lecanicillium fungicola]
MRVSHYVLAVAAVLDQTILIAHCKTYNPKAPMGSLSSDLVRHESAVTSHERRSGCGPVEKKCNGDCISQFDVCCDGFVCEGFEKCMDDGTCCELSFDSDCSGSGSGSGSSSSSTSCRSNEEYCGSKCMPAGSVCCTDPLGYCPAGTRCSGKKCLDGRSGDASVADAQVAAVVVALVAAIL